MNRRILIVAPHFAPTNAPDGHRVRQLIPHWVKAGYHCTVLTTLPNDGFAPVEMELMKTLPTSGCEIIRVPAYSKKWGIGNLGLRAKRRMARVGNKLLGRERFDLIYFSTTQFPVLPLGRFWKRKFKVPFVIDLQDPWLNDFYAQPGAPNPPGGWKYQFARWQAKREEARTLQEASHIISVSPAYLTALAERYPWFEEEKTSAIPFGWSEIDFEVAKNLDAKSDSPDLTILYVGRLGEFMEEGLDQLFGAYCQWKSRQSETSPSVYWRFVGTSYSGPSGGGVATRCARRHKLTKYVTESPDRLGNLESLSMMQSAAVNLILGSADSGYTPSKIWPLLATGRPWLAVVQNESNLDKSLSFPTTNGVCFRLPTGRVPDNFLDEFFDALTHRKLSPSPPNEIVKQYSSTKLARKHLEIFESVALELRNQNSEL